MFDYVIARSFHELLRSRLIQTCSFSTENLRLLLLAIRDYLTGHLAHCTPGDQENIHPAVIRQVQTQVHWFVQRWFEPLANDLDATAALISGAVMGAGIHYSEKQDVEMNVDQMVNILTQGLNGISITLD